MNAFPSPDDGQTRPTFAYEPDSTTEAAAPSASVAASADLAQRHSAAATATSTTSLAGPASADLAQRHSAAATATSTTSLAGPASADLAQRHSAMPPLPGAETTAPDYAGRLKARAQRINEEPSGTPGELTGARVAQLRTEAFARARVTQSPQRLTEWLVKQGLPQSEAEVITANAWAKAQATRRAAAPQKRNENGLAALEIIAGFVLLGIGLAAGWFVGLFLVPIIDGFRRLG